MSEDKGYSGNALDCLKKNNVKVGDSIKITADLTYSGILMPRYESGDDKHLVLKLGSGYNVGINVGEIQEIQIISSSEVKPKQDQEREEDPTLPKILLLSTGGTIASKVDTELVLLHLRLVLLISMKQSLSLQKLLTLMQKFYSRNIQKIYSRITGQKLQKNLTRLQTPTIRGY